MRSRGVGGRNDDAGSDRGMMSAGFVHHCLQKRGKWLICSAESMQSITEVVVGVECCCRGGREVVEERR